MGVIFRRIRYRAARRRSQAALTRRSFLGQGSLAALSTVMLGCKRKDKKTNRDAGVAKPRRSNKPATEGQLEQVELLRALAIAILPSELSPTQKLGYADGFVDWVALYREGAVIDSIAPYSTNTRPVTGPNPAARYDKELASLDHKARSSHGAGFARLGPAEQRTLVAAEISALSKDPVNIHPAGQLEREHVIVGFLMYFLRKPETINLVYGRAVNVYSCSGLPTDTEPPPKLRG